MEFVKQVQEENESDIEEEMDIIDVSGQTLLPVTDVADNPFYKLNAFNYGRHKYTETVEIIDCDKLSFIINNRDIFEPLLREERRFKGEKFEHYDPFLMADKYLKKSRCGKVKVMYKQKNGVGRKYAIKSLSLQNITRQIRQAICSDYYLDIDMKNCHPNILRFVCQNLGIACPILTAYCNNRDQFFIDNGMEKSVGKIVFLAIMNGGSSEYKKVVKPSLDLQHFYNIEITNIHDIIALLHNELFDKHREKRIADGITFNHKASFMNHLLCDIENKMLDVMWEFFSVPDALDVPDALESNADTAVLCFDGIMLKQGTYDLRGCEKALMDKLGIPMELDIKPFEDAFDLTPYDIPKYVEMSLDYYVDFRKLVGTDVNEELVDEWEKNSLVLIENGAKQYFLTKNKAIDSLTKDERVYYKQVREEDIFKNLKVKCNVLNPKFDYLFWKKIQDMKPAEKKNLKLSDDEAVSLKKYKYEMLGNGKFQSEGFLENRVENRTLKSYNNIEFAPYLSRNGVPKLFDSFNTFTGFPLERVKIKLITNIPVPITISLPALAPNAFEKSRLYKHLKEEMMDNNTGEFEHFLDHIADMIQDPMNIKTNGHLFYTKQGMGKGMLAEFVGKLLGVDHTISFENTEAYFGKFNADQQNKLLKIFEEVSDKGAAFQNHDRLKGDQSKKIERVEPKGIDPYSVRHCARFWYFTNNEWALFIPNDDRRFTCHKANNRYANNTEYFKPIWAEVKDLDFCKNAFEFFASRKYDMKSAYECYDTQFKKEQKQANLPNGLKYLKEVIESDFRGLTMDGDKVKAKDLGMNFKEWCSDGGIKFNIGSFRTQLKKLDIIDGSVRFLGAKAKCYTLNKDLLLKSYVDFLKDPDFVFEMVAETPEELDEIRRSDMGFQIEMTDMDE